LKINRFFLKEIETLREEKNHISSLFKGSSKEERLLLKEKSDNIKNRLQSLENERQEIEKQISVLEMSISNIPSKDTVLLEGYSYDDKKSDG
jgi:seryl-tRNA synthetase